MIWGGILVGAALWSVSALIFTFYHVINGAIALHRFIDDLDRSIYKTGAFWGGRFFCQAQNIRAQWDWPRELVFSFILSALLSVWGF